MMTPMTKKLLLGIPTVTLLAVLVCTVAGCGGSAPSGSAGSSGGSAPVEKKARPGLEPVHLKTPLPARSAVIAHHEALQLSQAAQCFLKYFSQI